MRKLYTSPKADVIEFDTKDVITTSGTSVSNDPRDYVEDAPDWSEGWN